MQILLNSIALDPNRWTKDKLAYFSLEQLLNHVARAGFHFIEVWQYHISRATENEIRNYQKIANSLGISFPAVGMYPTLHLAGQERKDELDKVERLMNYAELLEADIVKVFVGVRGSDKVTHSEYQASVQFMHEILALADDRKLTITGETHTDTLFDSLESCQRFLKAVDSENLKVCFQPFDFCNTEKAVGDFRLLADDVIHVHYQGRKNGTMDLLSESDLDYDRLTKALIEAGFSGKICIEFVKDCVVKTPGDFDLNEVLKNAVLDRDFIIRSLEKYGQVGLAH
ncbi:sugar phosphate isomerase/epimerase [bacterium]|nr:sugar phosphate isomerase/epimerase [bacterium]